MSALLAADRAARRQASVLALLACAAVLVAAVYWDTYRSIVGVWQSTQYGHGMLVLPVTAFLIWRIRRRLGEAALEPLPWGMVPTAILVLLWFVGAAVGAQVVEQVAAVLLIAGAALTLLGWPITRSALFPLLFLVAAVPIGDGLLPYLMQITATLSTALLNAAGVPVFRQGQFLSLPGGDFEIADVCAGMQYLTAGTIIGLLFSYLAYRSYAKRMALVATMVVAMILTNALRAFVVMLVASATQMRYMAGADHIYFGWILFAAVVTALIYVAGRFSDREPRVPAPPTGEEPSPSLVEAYRRPRGVLALCGTAVVLAGGPFLLASRPIAAPAAAHVVDLPAIDACAGPEAWAGDSRPRFESPDSAVYGSYVCAGQPVNVFVAVYLSNAQGREVVGRSNELIPPSWRAVATPKRHGFDAGDGRVVRVNELEVEAAGMRSLVWYWYAVGGRPLSSETAVKFVQALQLLVEGGSDGSAYLVQTPLDHDVEASRRRMAEAARRIAEL